MFKKLSLLAVVLMLSACTATTRFQATDPSVDVRISSKPEFQLNGDVAARKFRTTSFGQYRFSVSNGEQTMYGALPLKFNHGYLILDILFFAPATFFNLREVFPYYEFDVTNNVVRYRTSSNKPWVNYTPSAEEAARAKAHLQ